MNNSTFNCYNMLVRSFICDNELFFINNKKYINKETLEVLQHF